jgi:hypothetical protein
MKSCLHLLPTIRPTGQSLHQSHPSCQTHHIGKLIIMVVSPASRTDMAPTLVRQAKSQYKTINNKLPMASSDCLVLLLVDCVKKSTMMLAFCNWQKGKQREMAKAIPICVISTSPGMGCDQPARMMTLKVVNKPVSSATAAPTTPKARHKGAMSNVEKFMNGPQYQRAGLPLKK